MSSSDFPNCMVRQLLASKKKVKVVIAGDGQVT